MVRAGAAVETSVYAHRFIATLFADRLSHGHVALSVSFRSSAAPRVVVDSATLLLVMLVCGGTASRTPTRDVSEFNEP